MKQNEEKENVKAVEVPEKAPPKDADAAQDTRRPLIQVNPTWGLGLIIVACIFGILLLLAGLGGELYTALDGILSTTLIVSGLALIFAAFGSQATVQYKGWVVAGVAAIALVFLYAINNLRNDSYVVVELVSSKTPTTTMKAGTNEIFKGSVQRGSELLRTRFFVRYRDISDDAIRFDVEMPNTNDKQSEPLVHEICFARNKLVRWFGRSGYLNWRLNEVEWAVYDQDKKPIGSKKACGVEQTSITRLPNFIVSPANAQGVLNVTVLIEDLLSENTDVRRLSRELLADQGPSVIRPLMDRATAMAASRNRLAFRMQVGAAVAIDGMISRGAKSDKTSSQDVVRKALNESDFKAIVEWSMNEDASIRVPAARILANISDVPTLLVLMKETEGTRDEDVLYNTAWILRQSAQRVRSDQAALTQIKQIAKKMNTDDLGAKTKAFLNQVDQIQ